MTSQMMLFTVSIAFLIVAGVFAILATCVFFMRNVPDAQAELSGKKRAAALAYGGGAVAGYQPVVPGGQAAASQANMMLFRGRHAKPESHDKARAALRSIPTITPEDPDATLVFARREEPSASHARTTATAPVTEFTVVKKIVLTDSDEVVRVD